MDSSSMELSLLFALLGPEPPAQGQSISQDPGDVVRKRKYHEMGAKEKKEVRAEVYKNLYAILEYSDINRDLAKAIGMALSSAVRGDIEKLKGDAGVKRLYDVLKPIVNDAIDERKP